MDRAYSLLDIKSINEDTRVITGIASTPGTDRDGDIMESKGAVFTLPIPLLWQHNHEQPIGEVFAAEVTAAGISIQARIAKIDEPGQLKDFLDLAWQSIKAKLVKGLSVGFKPLDRKPLEKTGGIHFLKWLWLELSAVTVPANMQATIQQIKSFDMAASGLHSPGVTGTATVSRGVKAAPIVMTIQEQITQFENTRAAKDARRNEIQQKASAEGRTKDQAEREEFDTLRDEIASVDNELKDLREMEKSALAKATMITCATNTSTGADLRGGVTSTTPIISVKSMLPKGTGFTRMVMAKAACQGNKWEAAEYAKRWDDTTPEVSRYLKTAVSAGTTTDSTFAAPLAVANPMANEFIELLRPKTLLGRIANLRRVPFNVSVPSQTAGGTYGWVGQGKVKPLTSLATATVTLAINKIAGIIVLTEELVRISTPSAEELVRNEMIAGITKFMDEQFIDPSIAASGTVSPASITNGTSAITSAGTSNDNAKTDLKALMASFVTANLSTDNAVWIMSEANAFALSMAVGALGQPLFPGLSVNGGTLFGRPVITTQSAGTTVALVDAQGILVADDGGVSVDVSREASLQMDTAPTDPPDASSVYVSMFQNNLVALRAERFVTWKRARTASVKYVAASYA